MKIALAGDVMLGRLVNQHLKVCPPAYPWGNILPILQTADLRICNLECVLSDVGSPWSSPPKIFHFRTDKKNVETLHAAPIDIVSIANNHVLDYEDSALLEMLETLEKHRIAYTGAGRNLEQAMQPAVRMVQGKKVGVIAFTDNEPDWEASTSRCGIHYVPVDLKDKRAIRLLKHVKAVRKEVDFLILSPHWGPNWGYDPPKAQIPFAHALIEAGADLIFGHSGHIFRGIEFYKDCPIIYCGGDFIDDYAVDEIERNDESFLFIVEPPHIHLYPTLIEFFQANLAPTYRREAIVKTMEVLCKRMGTDLSLIQFH